MALAALFGASSVAAARLPAGTPVPFADLPGFAADDHAAAFATFLTTCHGIVADAAPLRQAAPPPSALKTACRAALALPKPVDGETARRFFEARFTPRRLEAGFLTGYYEPVVEGSLVPTPRFATPLLARPPERSHAALPDRAAIEAGALGAAAPPLVYVRDPVEAFFIHVQGSARIALPDGTMRRLVYAGRNGLPYTSIGKLLVDRLHIPPAEMGLAQLKGWIREHGQKPGDEGTALMALNRSFIFFAFDDTLPRDAGPIGGAGVSLTPLRSLAIDRQVWPYGVPVFLDAVLPWYSEQATPFQRLMVAQDTGSAIVGPARGDIFFGSGNAAAERAGPIRHPASFYVLWPKDEPEQKSVTP